MLNKLRGVSLDTVVLVAVGSVLIGSIIHRTWIGDHEAATLLALIFVMMIDRVEVAEKLAKSHRRMDCMRDQMLVLERDARDAREGEATAIATAARIGRQHIATRRN